MPITKRDIPDMYNDIPFPPGYFEKPAPHRCYDDEYGWHVFIALDYAMLEGKEFPRLTLDEMMMMFRVEDGKLINVSRFAEYLESNYF